MTPDRVRGLLRYKKYRLDLCCKKCASWLLLGMTLGIVVGGDQRPVHVSHHSLGRHRPEAVYRDGR